MTSATNKTGRIQETPAPTSSGSKTILENLKNNNKVHQDQSKNNWTGSERRRQRPELTSKINTKISADPVTASKQRHNGGKPQISYIAKPIKIHPAFASVKYRQAWWIIDTVKLYPGLRISLWL